MKSWMKLLACLSLCATATSVLAEAVDNDPCLGPTALLSIVDRPSNSDSACAVPFRQAVVEMGVQYAKLNGSGTGVSVPEPELRVGLPWKNELFILLPNYFHQTVAPTAGFGTTTVGLKHETSYNSTLQTAVEGAVILPLGSRSYGSLGTGVTVNGIVSYSMTQDLNFTLQLGLSTQTAASYNGGQRFNTFNPDFVVTYNIIPMLDIYGEAYGQTRTGPNQGSGFNCDGGVIYLLNKNMTLDAEVGQRISGALQGFQHYIGVGGAIRF